VALSVIGGVHGNMGYPGWYKAHPIGARRLDPCAGLLKGEKSMSPKTRIHPPDDKKIEKDSKGLYKIGGAAALIAGLLFRRNLGAEVSLVSKQAQPTNVVDWFTLLYQNKLLGLTYLNIFDVVDYALLGLMLLALYAALKHNHKSAMTVATTFGLVGMGVYFASNTAFSMLALSRQYAVATTEAQKSMLLAAGQALLAINDPASLSHGTGLYVSFLFLALATFIISVVMLQSNLFGKVTAYTGILGAVLDLLYCVTFAFIPSAELVFIPAAGLFLCIWHILVGYNLIQLGRRIPG
jgi:hypothetical protein